MNKIHYKFKILLQPIIKITTFRVNPCKKLNIVFPKKKETIYIRK